MKKINWFDHLANLLVVILGISIAFYLENYKESSNNRKQAKKYVASLLKDVEADIEVLDTLLAVNDNIVESLIVLSNATVGGSYGSNTDLKNHVFATQYNPAFHPQRTIYESLKTSGKIDLIGDFDLRNQIIELYEQYYLRAHEYDVAINDHVRDFVRPFFIANMKFNGRESIGPEFLNKQNFRNMIFAYRYLFIDKNNFYRDIQEKVKELKSAMEKIE